MCRQEFVYYACKHSMILNQPCELAIDDPFYIPVICPNYVLTNAHPPDRGCGRGGYYCTVTKDGKFLNYVHESYDRTQDWLRRLDAELLKVIKAANDFVQAATYNGVARDTWTQDPVYNKIHKDYQEMRKKRVQPELTSMHALHIITQATQYFRLAHQQQSMGNESELPRIPVPPWVQKGLLETGGSHNINQTTAKPIPEYKGIPAEVMRSFIHPSSRQASEIFYHRAPHQAPQQPPLTQMHQMYHIKQQCVPDAAISTSTAIHPGHRESEANVPSGQPQRRSKRGGSRGNLPSEPSTPIMEKKTISSRVINRGPAPKTSETATNVRRSGRVRAKPVKYAESSGSSSPARSVSPARSDKSFAEDSSPNKSDSVLSPEKKRSNLGGRRDSQQSLDNVVLHRSGSSLASTIFNFNRSHAESPILQTRTMNNGGLFESMNASRELTKSTLRFQLDIKIGDAAETHYSSEAMVRHDSGYGQIGEVALSNAPPADYGGMRRSFSSIPTLKTPPEQIRTPGTDDPRKRKIDVSSESNPAKRVRLSLPELSPPAAQPGADYFEYGHQESEVPLAPILTPNRVIKMQAQPAQEDCLPGGGKEPKKTNEQHAIGEDIGPGVDFSEFSDIDWDLIDS